MGPFFVSPLQAERASRSCCSSWECGFIPDDSTQLVCRPPRTAHAAGGTFACGVSRLGPEPPRCLFMLQRARRVLLRCPCALVSLAGLLRRRKCRLLRARFGEASGERGRIDWSFRHLADCDYMNSELKLSPCRMRRMASEKIREQESCTIFGHALAAGLSAMVSVITS